MTIEEIKARIGKKEEEIAKLERLYEKYASEDAQEKSIIDRFLESGDRTEYREYLRSHNRNYGGDAWSKANSLYDARVCLTKYQKQLESEVAKEATLNEMPEVLKEFGTRLVTRWDNYDLWKQDRIREESKSEPAWSDRANYRKWHWEMREKWGSNWYEFKYLSPAEIHKQNVKDAETLVLNLINRTVDIAGKITDCQYLCLEQDNLGYSIINGIVIGEKGKARVESIGAGGYNIQRYHIRVLVKEIK